jgi:hypothetical protein
MSQELAARAKTTPAAVRSAARAGEPSAAALEALLDELGAEEAAFVLVCYADGGDHEALARVMDRRTGARGVAAHGIPGAGAGLTGFALHGGGMVAAIEIIPQLEQLSLLALDTVPRRLMRALGRGVEELKPGRHVWLTLFDARARREPFLAPLISRWAPLELVGGSLAGPYLRQGALLHHGRLWRNAAAVVLLESALPMRTIQHTHLALTDRWMTVTRVSADGLGIEELDGEPAIPAYARALGVSCEALTSGMAARHPFGLRFRGRAFPVVALHVTAQRQLRMGVAIPEGDRLNLLEPIDLLERTRALMGSLSEHDGAVLLFDCVNRLAEADATGVQEDYVAALHRSRACVIHSYGEQFGYMHLNCSMTGLAFGAPEGLASQPPLR